MIIVDTSVWIPYLKRSDEELYNDLKMYLKEGRICAISAVFGELLQGVRNKREKELIMLLWENLPKVDERNLFVHAGLLSLKHKLYSSGIGLIDCYLLAAAKENNYALWSLDKKLNAAIPLI